MSIKLFNTLSNKKEEFKPLKEGKVKMYVCGPTVYGPDHLGHGRVGVFYDVLKRYLQYKDYDVRMVSNITDVGHLSDDADQGEDKIEKKAQETGKSPQEIADYYTKRHFNDMAKLNVLRPDDIPKASDYIPKMIEFIKKLIDKGFAYEKEGNVYFDVSMSKDYGKLSGRKPQELKEAVRIKEDKNKKSPLDFALWLKAESNHSQKWDSPWSKGYPGWHIECSVMIKDVLGERIDIHGGAIELSFPHHENEIAQTEALTGKQFVKYWVHIGLVTVEGEKMSKSKGNFITLRDMLLNYDPDQIRIALLLTSYKKPFDYSKKRLEEAKKVLDKIRRAYQRAEDRKDKKLREEFEAIMDDNINTPALISFILQDLDSIGKKLFDDIKQVLGLRLKQIKVPDKIKKLAQQREQLREEGNYKKADKIRKKIENEGYLVEDIEKGFNIKIK